jgi:hypothetical protein
MWLKLSPFSELWRKSIFKILYVHPKHVKVSCIFSRFFIPYKVASVHSSWWNLCCGCERYRVWIKLFLCFNWAPHHVGVLGEWRYSSTHSLTSALDGGEWSASRSGRFTPRERVPGTHGIGGWVGPRAVVDAVVKRKIPSPRRESNPRTPTVQPVAQRYTDWAITALAIKLHLYSIKTTKNIELQ